MASSGILPDVNFGTVGQQLLDWRAKQDFFSGLDDDTELEFTPYDVIDILGFDPKELRQTPFGDADWQKDAKPFNEEDHPRGHEGNPGEFTKKGTGFVHRTIGAGATYGMRKMRELTEHDHHILSQHFHKPDSAPRRSWAQHTKHVATILPRLLHGHWLEEKQKATGAARALRGFASGNAPYPEDVKALKSLGLRVLLSAGSMAVTGDPTGTVGHLAAALSEELVNHVVAEHAATLGGGMIRFLGQKLSKPSTDATPELSDEDYALLAQFIQRLARAAHKLDIPDERVAELLAKNNEADDTHDAFVESDHPRGQEKNKGQFVEKGKQQAPRTVNKGTSGKEYPSDTYKKVKALARDPSRATKQELNAAIDYLFDTKMSVEYTLSPDDQSIVDKLQTALTERIKAEMKAKEDRAKDFAYMSDEEIKEATGIAFGGDSRMKPGMKVTLSYLPPEHLEQLARLKFSINAVQSLPPMSMSHPYAPGMAPAGQFEPLAGRISVADEIILPNGTHRQLLNRRMVLRHEIGHAMAEITSVASNSHVTSEIDKAIERMTPEEKDKAAYWIGNTATSESGKLRTRRSESFAELYAYAYNEGEDVNAEQASFGGMSNRRRFEVFAPAKAALIEEMNKWFEWRRTYTGPTYYEVQRRIQQGLEVQRRIQQGLNDHATGDAQMIQYGYRLYIGLDDKLHFDQIVNGRIYALKPNEDDAKKPLGYYDADMELVESEDEPSKA